MALHDLPRKRLTYEDYVLFPDDGNRHEIIEFAVPHARPRARDHEHSHDREKERQQRDKLFVMRDVIPIQSAEVPGAVGLAHATQSAQPLPAGEAQLLDHRMRQDASPIQPVRIGTRRARPPRRPSQRHAGSPTR